MLTASNSNFFVVYSLSLFLSSPNGYRVRSLTEAADYVQRDGTCKCGLPCPLRLQLVFNFDPSVSSGTPGGRTGGRKECTGPKNEPGGIFNRRVSETLSRCFRWGRGLNRAGFATLRRLALLN